MGINSGCSHVPKIKEPGRIFVCRRQGYIIWPFWPKMKKGKNFKGGLDKKESKEKGKKREKEE